MQHHVHCPSLLQLSKPLSKPPMWLWLPWLPVSCLYSTQATRLMALEWVLAEVLASRITETRIMEGLLPSPVPEPPPPSSSGSAIASVCSIAAALNCAVPKAADGAVPPLRPLLVPALDLCSRFGMCAAQGQARHRLAQGCHMSRQRCRCRAKGGRVQFTISKAVQCWFTSKFVSCRCIAAAGGPYRCSPTQGHMSALPCPMLHAAMLVFPCLVVSCSALPDPAQPCSDQLCPATHALPTASQWGKAGPHRTTPGRAGPTTEGGSRQCRQGPWHGKGR